MYRFPSGKNLCSWAGLTPGYDKSAGKKLLAKVHKDNVKSRSALIGATESVSRQKRTLICQYHRIAARRGKNKEAVTVTYTMLGIIYHMLTKR